MYKYFIIIIYFVYIVKAFLYSFNFKNNPMNKKYNLCGNCQFVEIINNQTMNCKLFGKINLLNGNIHYQSCSITRNNESQCGIIGKNYVCIYENKQHK